jgi:hypothetical protein
MTYGLLEVVVDGRKPRVGEDRIGH